MMEEVATGEVAGVDVVVVVVEAKCQEAGHERVDQSVITGEKFPATQTTGRASMGSSTCSC